LAGDNIPFMNLQVQIMDIFNLLGEIVFENTKVELNTLFQQV